MKQLITALFFIASFPVFAQYDGEAKSIQLYPMGNDLGDPIISLSGGTSLVLEFDVLGEEAPSLSYSIIHCNYDWEKSMLSPLEYIDGFSNGTLTDYDFSFNAEQYYTHFTFEFPNRNLQPLVSGNYKILVYEDSPSEPLFERQFIVTEQVAQITGRVDNATGTGKRQTHHQINLTALYEGLTVTNPRQEFKMDIYQNLRPDNALKNISMQRFDRNRLFYSNPFKQNFDAGNEFRWFNTRSFRYKTEGIAEYLQKEDGVHAYLVPDRVRQTTRFVPYNDFNGRYRIDRQEGVNDDLDADYSFVHFYLKEEPTFQDKEVYLYGALTDWQIDDTYKLTYNEKQGLLSTTAYLKQGNYDYTYLVKDGDEYSTAITEGSSFRTENIYTALLYYTPFGARYDRLVAVSQFDSRFN